MAKQTEFIWHKTAKPCDWCGERTEEIKCFFSFWEGKQDFIYYCSKNCLQKIMDKIVIEAKKKKSKKNAI